MICKKLDGCICHTEQLLFRSDQWKEFSSLTDMISKSTTKRYKKCLIYIPCIYRTGFCTSATIVAFFIIDDQFIILERNCFFTTCLFADTTMNTGIFFPADLCCSLDSNIIFFCFEAVVLTSRHTKFKLVRKFSSKISFV